MIDPQEIETLITSSDPEQMRLGLQRVKEGIAQVGSQEARPLFELVSSVFYIDAFDRPDLAPILNEAISLVIGFGNWVIPALIEKLDMGDMKSQLASAEALGRLGVEAIEPLVARYQATEDPALRSFVLYALGKMKCEKVERAIELCLESSRSHDLELRDTAIRAIGRIVEVVPAARVDRTKRDELHDVLRTTLADTDNSVRAKAVRSLGKLAKNGYLDPQQRETLKGIALNLTGRDEKFDWDHAYVVRKEAEATLQFCDD